MHHNIPIDLLHCIHLQYNLAYTHMWDNCWMYTRIQHLYYYIHMHTADMVAVQEVKAGKNHICHIRNILDLRLIRHSHRFE